jgi:hypothetical protein
MLGALASSAQLRQAARSADTNLPVPNQITPKSNQTGVSPRVAPKTEATIVDQNVYWLSTPIAPGKARTFSVQAKVSPSLPSGPVTISTLVYALGANGTVACASAMQDATVSLCTHVCMLCVE